MSMKIISNVLFRYIKKGKIEFYYIPYIHIACIKTNGIELLSFQFNSTKYIHPLYQECIMILSDQKIKTEFNYSLFITVANFTSIGKCELVDHYTTTGYPLDVKRIII